MSELLRCSDGTFVDLERENAAIEPLLRELDMQIEITSEEGLAEAGRVRVVEGVRVGGGPPMARVSVWRDVRDPIKVATIAWEHTIPDALAGDAARRALDWVRACAANRN